MKTFEFTEEQIKMLDEVLGLHIALLDASGIDSIKADIPKYQTLLNYINS